MSQSINSCYYKIVIQSLWFVNAERTIIGRFYFTIHNYFIILESKIRSKFSLVQPVKCSHYILLFTSKQETGVSRGYNGVEIRHTLYGMHSFLLVDAANTSSSRAPDGRRSSMAHAHHRRRFFPPTNHFTHARRDHFSSKSPQLFEPARLVLTFIGKLSA